MGGKVKKTAEELYMADRSPLKKTRGAVNLRLKRDYDQVNCCIVSTEFCIQLGDKHDYHRDSTVFAYVSDGLAICDAMSHIDCKRDNLSISSIELKNA